VNATAALHRLGQSLWLDTITRTMLDDGTLARYVADLSITGLTSNPTIYNLAVKGSAAYDAAIAATSRSGLDAEGVFFELALDDLTRAADLFRPIHDRTGGLDGWVSLEVSPHLAYDAAEAYLRGVERRIDAGLSPRVVSVASLFISRWDAASAADLPPSLTSTLGIAVGARCYEAYRALLASDRFQRLANFGALPQRLLFASTGTKDPALSDHLYVRGLAAPHTINTMPEPTLLAFADHGTLGGVLSPGGGQSSRTLFEIARAGVDIPALGERLQAQGAAAFVKSWDDLLQVIAAKAAA
jgi:transaldolase